MIRKFITKNGLTVGFPCSTLEHLMAHTDIDWDILSEALRKINYRGGFVKYQFLLFLSYIFRDIYAFCLYRIDGCNLYLHT